MSIDTSCNQPEGQWLLNHNIFSIYTTRTQKQSETHKALITQQIKSSARPIQAEAGSVCKCSHCDFILRWGGSTWAHDTPDRGVSQLWQQRPSGPHKSSPHASSGWSSPAVTISPAAHRPVRWLIVEERMTGNFASWRWLQKSRYC